MTEIIPFDRDLAGPPHKRITEVLIVASQELIRDVLRSTLASVDQVRVIGESRQGEEAMQAVEELRPDVVVIESQIGPDAEGVRSGYLFKAARPSLGIVVLAHGFGPEVIQYLTGKAPFGWSFITRAASLEPQRLWKAIAGAASGHGVIDPGLENATIESSIPLLERLTVRQARVLELVAAGISDSGIASRLALTQAETHKLIESLYHDMRIEAGSRVDRRVVATLVYLRESVRLRGYTKMYAIACAACSNVSTVTVASASSSFSAWMCSSARTRISGRPDAMAAPASEAVFHCLNSGPKYATQRSARSPSSPRRRAS